MNQKELFANYEFDSTKWRQVLLKILGGSLVFHIILFLSLIYVPVVRDAFYVALLFSEAPSGWGSNKDYKKTDFEDVEVITFNTPPADQLQYPAGYFNLANGDAPPADFAALTNPPAPEVVATDVNMNGFPSVPVESPTPFPTPDVTTNFPPINPPASKSSSGGLDPLPRKKKGAKLKDFEPVNGSNSTTPQPTPKQNEVAEVKPSPTPSPEDPNAVKLNKEPWFKLGAEVKPKFDKLDLTKPLTVRMEGELDKDGKIVGTLQRSKAEGDAELVEFVTKMILALDESEMLRYVRLLNQDSPKRKIAFNVIKDNENVRIEIEADTTSQTRANIAQSLLSSYLQSEVKRAKDKGREEAGLLDKLTVETGTNQVIIKWAMPMKDAVEVLKKKLAELPKEQQPPSTGQTGNSNAQAAK